MHACANAHTLLSKLALDEPACPACAQYLAGSFQAGVDTLFRQLTQVGVQG